MARGPFLKQPVFNWTGKDKYTKLKQIELEVMVYPLYYIMMFLKKYLLDDTHTYLNYVCAVHAIYFIPSTGYM